jgi:hypothetical protein
MLHVFGVVCNWGWCQNGVWVLGYPDVKIIVDQCIPLCTLFIDVGYRVYRDNLSQYGYGIPVF